MESEDRLDPGQILDISRRKQKKDPDSEDLYRTVLVNNTVKIAEQEVRKSILQSIFF